jgi:hypothetical protein
MSDSYAPGQLPAAPALKLGFTGTLTGYIRTNQTKGDTTELEFIKDEDGNDAVCVITNKGNSLQATAYIKSDTTVPRKGSTLAIGSVRYLVRDVSVEEGATASRVTLDLYKPDATTWATT